MIDKYEDKFKEMCEGLKNGKSLSDIIEENTTFFEQKGIGRLGLIYYFTEYIKKINSR